MSKPQLKNLAHEIASFCRTNLNPTGNYIAQNSIMASRKFGITLEKAEELIRRTLNDADLSNPIVTYYERNRDTLDRHLKTISVSGYLKKLQRQDVIVSPSGTTYVKRNVLPSFISNMSESGMKKRSKIKLLQFQAKNDGDQEAYDFWSGSSNGIKIGINSISGSLVSKGSIIRNKSGHSTLTSISRMTVSASNILAEYINGNRFYNSYEVAQSSVLTMLQLTGDRNNGVYGNWEELKARYHLVVPTVDNIMTLIKDSSAHYWQDSVRERRLSVLVGMMDDIERIAFMYTGDMFHLYKFNPELGEVLYDGLAEKPSMELLPNAKELVKDIPGDVLNHAHHLLIEEMVGQGTNYSTMSDELVSGIVRGSYKTMETLHEYKFLLQSVLCSEYYGPNIVHLYDMIRFHIPASDTDSTVMSVDAFVGMVRGKMVLDPLSYRLGSAHSLLFNQALDNTLIQMAVNMNVEEKYLQTMKMKSELTTAVIGLGSRSKQYYTSSKVLEGNVLAEIDLVVKGVELKSSNIPKSIRVAAQDRMKEVIRTLERNELISIHEIMREVLKVEQNIYSNILKGGLEFFKPAQIKELEAYKNRDGRSPYDWYVWWSTTYGKFVGRDVLVPYRAIKVPTTLVNKTALNNWVNSLDPALGSDMARWLQMKKKTTLPTLYLPVEYVVGNGMPECFHDIIDSKKIVRDLTNIYYRLLETLGYLKVDKLTLSESLLGMSPSELHEANIEELI